MRILRLLATFLAAIAAVHGQPVIDAVMNSASFALPGMPGSAIAQGSMFVIFGRNLGPPVLRVASSLPLQTALAGTSVRVSVSGVTTDAFVFYAYESQVACVLPSATPAGTGVITVSYRGAVSAQAAIKVTRSSPGLFARNQAGTGPAIIQNFQAGPVWPVNALNETAHPGGIAVAWATGLGPIVGDDSTYPPVGNLPFGVEVIVGGKPAKVDYAGRSPYYAGIDQINFVVPDGVDGCYVPVNLKVDGVLANPVTMSISASGANCSDPSGLSASELARVLAAGEARIGVVNLGQDSSALRLGGAVTEGSVDQGSGTFFRRTAAELLAGLGPVQVSSAAGACMVYGLRAQDDIQWFPYDPVPRQPLDAGSALTVAGAAGTREIPRVRDGFYSATLGGAAPGQPAQPSFLQPGDYTAGNGSGGLDVAGFRSALRIPAPFTWQIPSAGSGISRAQALTVSWSGGEPASQMVSIVGASIDNASQVVGAFVCQEKATAGRFTVPSWVLSAIPAGNSIGLPSTYPAGLLGVSARPLPGAGRSTAAGLDLAYIQYTLQRIVSVYFL